MLAGAHYGLANIPQRWLAQLDQNVAKQIRAQTLALIERAISRSDYPQGTIKA
jgi:ADP-ribosyl-[dinitrogen reductase] hydrolase